MHPDPELLSLIALGENAGTEADRAHAETCPACAAELSELRRVVTLGRSVAAETSLATPSTRVWARIRDELALSRAPGLAGEPSTFLPSETPEPLTVARLLGAAAAGQGHELKAHARLAPVGPSWSRASGRAELAADEHGRRLLRVALEAELPTTGVRQAWLVHRDDPGSRQTLGVLDGPHGLWTIEHSIDLGQYAILDISQQDIGQTEHSGQTIVRGELTLVG